MAKLPIVSGSEAVKALQRLGFSWIASAAAMPS
jgi:predicted RNA binding protein YcfA (HicA-like mRNA interferase family)